MSTKTETPPQTLFEALAKAQSEFPSVLKNKEAPLPGGQNKTRRYADLTAVYEAILPCLNRNGLTLVHKSHGLKTEVQPKTIKEATGALDKWGKMMYQNVAVEGLVTVLQTEPVIYYKDGTSLSGGIFCMPVNQCDAHGYGSGLTYLQRYSTSAMLCVASTEDDDANAAVETMHHYAEPPAKKAPAAPTQAEIDFAAKMLNACTDLKALQATWSSLSEGLRTSVGDIASAKKKAFLKAEADKLLNEAASAADAEDAERLSRTKKDHDNIQREATNGL
jgi:hypothetical protein